MSNRLRDFWRNVRDALSLWGLGLALFVIGMIIALQFVGPPPPKHIVLATGAEGGAYRRYGEKLAAELAREGIKVELRETAGSGENLDLLENDDAVHLAFVQGGLADAIPTQSIRSLGSLYFEPLFVFVREDGDISEAADFAGKRIAVGAPGSGTRPVALALLELNGLGPQSVQTIDTQADDLAQAFGSKSIDAAFLIGAPDSDYVAQLIATPGVAMLGLSRADAYVRYAPYLSKLTLPEGVLDLRRNQPPAALETVAVTAMLVTKDNFHPALTDLLLVSAQKVFGKHSLLADAGQFPTERYADLPLSDEAARFYQYGAPFLMRYLPFWAATLVERLWIVLLPFIGLAIPLVKVLPVAYRWRIRRRLLQRYTALEKIDPFGNPVKDARDREERLQALGELDDVSAGEIVPRSYVDDVYKLRRDIDLVRRRLQQTA